MTNVAGDYHSSDTFEKTKKKSNEDMKTGTFPKKVGIVFVEEASDAKKTLKNYLNEFLHKTRSVERDKPRLNFNQIPCSHILLQMNTVQNIFDFQIVRLKFPNQLSYSIEGYNLKWFNEQIYKIENNENYERGEKYDIDYWIGITSDKIEHNWYYIGEEEEKPRKAIITSLNWEEVNSPPSLFEYLSLSVLICSLYCVDREFNGMFRSHPKSITKGCIYDFTIFKPDRRILVSNPYLCSICRERMSDLEKVIQGKTSSKVAFSEGINKFLAREWMGDPEKRDSPLYNLKKNYGYDINRNSGFNKKWWEIIRDSIVERTAEWIVGGIIGVIMLLVGNFLSGKG